MKNRHRLNILTSLIAVLFILSLFSGIASANNPREQYEKAQRQYQIQKDKYDSTREKFNKAEERYNAAKLKFKSTKNDKSRAELKDRTKEYLERAIDQMIAHLQALKSRIEDPGYTGTIPFNASKNIDARITQLENIRTDIQQADTRQEIEESIRELRDIWTRIRLETRYYLGILANHRVGMFLEKADNVSAGVNETIQQLRDQGKDTAKLERDASRFDNQVDEAKESYQKVLNLYASHRGFDSSGMVTSNQEAQAFISESDSLQKNTLKELNDVSRQLRDLFEDTKKLEGKGKKAIVSGTGTLEANGNGRAVLEGNLTMTLSGINGTLIVSGNANVTTDGTGTREVLGNGDVKYQGFGQATIEGDNINIKISGNGINLTATGTGFAVLNGNGTYRTTDDFGVSGQWDREG